MSLPEPVRSERVGALAAELARGDDGRRGAADGRRGTGDSDAAERATPAGGPVARGVLAGRTLLGRARAGRGGVVGTQVRRQARRVAARAVRPIVERAATPGRELGHQAMQQVADLDRSLASVRVDVTEWEIERGDLRTGLVNLELLKGEVRAMGDTLEQLARAIAPAFGLPAAASALAELRERVTSCERRLRYLETARPPRQPEVPATGAEAPDGAGARPGRPAGAGGAPSSTLFDYAGFERRFRGSPEDVLAILDERYGELLMANPPVLDIGCGRAELVALLTERGVAAMGVDTDPSMVADARERGLDVVEADAVSFLREQSPGSLGAVVATHVLEHLTLDPLLELLELAQSRLRPGGVFIAETPNPASLVVLGNSYILDPTHVRPLHPKLLEFLCEAAGFRNLEVRFFGPATAFQMDLIDDAEAPPWAGQVNRALEHLNQVLFGPQDFAIVATASGPTPAPDEDQPG